MGQLWTDDILQMLSVTFLGPLLYGCATVHDFGGRGLSDSLLKLWSTTTLCPVQLLAFPAKPRTCII